VYSDANVANRDVRGFGCEMTSRGRFATPAGFPLHDCSPYSHVRCDSLGFVPRSRTLFCHPVPNPKRDDSLLEAKSQQVDESDITRLTQGHGVGACQSMIAAASGAKADVQLQVRFCRDHFSPTGELKYRGAVG
jgi:hypothetical protein